MKEHDLLLIAGTPGSGKSRLGRALAHRLSTPDYHAVHVSTGDTIRAVANGQLPLLDRHRAVIADHLNSKRVRNFDDYPVAIPERLTPLPEDIVYGVLATHLLAGYHEANLVILDGYPRSSRQVDGTFRLAENLQRTVKGILITTTTTEIATGRQLKRDAHTDRGDSIDEQTALWRIRESDHQLEPMLDRLCDPLRYNLPARIVDTTQDKTETDRRGAKLARELLRLFPTEDLEGDDVYDDEPDSH